MIPTSNFFAGNKSYLEFKDFQDDESSDDEYKNDEFLKQKDDEQIGIDFINFYFLLRTIRAVKFYSKTKFGSLLEDEWKKLIGEHSMFFQMNKYALGSTIMNGDQKI